jgi:mannonate dehydratase
VIHSALDFGHRPRYDPSFAAIHVIRATQIAGPPKCFGRLAAPGERRPVKILENLPWERVNDDTLRFLKAIGVDELSIHPSPPAWDGRSRLDYWLEMSRLARSHGLALTNVGTKTWEDIALGTAGCEAALEAWCTLLRDLGKAGIRSLGYTFQPGGYFRTEPTPGRGGARYSSFDYERLKRDEPRRPEIDEPQLWENLDRFLGAVLPVAEEAGVLMALHPDDPPVAEPLGGAARIVSSLKHFERIFDMRPSPSHAMLFCQGCVAEMGEDVPAAIRRMGKAGKIAYVHFRNIRGSAGRFQEVFVDEGDQDMYEAMKAYREVGFQGPFMMDHTPGFPDDAWTFQAGRGFAVGYIRALIQAAYR